MILSISRRTDIPAFYIEWLFNRLNEGYVMVRNPMNYHQVSKIILSPDLIDCIVFWTKDPSKILDRLESLEDYNYYFQITVNPYDCQIERNVSTKMDVIESFKKLSTLIGKHKTIWRYDPIILTDIIDIEYHFKCFDLLSSKLKGYTERCIISFVDMYKKSEINMKRIGAVKIKSEDMIEIGKKFSDIALNNGFKVETCSEFIDLSFLGIEHAKCVDEKLISRIIGNNLNIQKDRNQRDTCGCVTSIDIGAYNTCKHGCLYCYANYSDRAVKENSNKHDPSSPMLIGNIEPNDVIYVRKMESCRETQLNLFDFRSKK